MNTDRTRARAARACEPAFIQCDPPRCERLREADHRIANDLAMIAGMVSLRTAEIDRVADVASKQSVLLVLRGLGVQIEAISQLHRLLAASGAPARIDVATYLHALCRPLSALSAESRLVEDLAPGSFADAHQIAAIGQIVVEVVTNAVKYARNPAREASILVSCRPTSDNAVLLEVSDRGPGLPAGLDPATDGGLGFRLIRALGAQLGAALAFDSSPSGCRFSLALPATQ